MNERYFVNKFIKDFNIPRDKVRVKKGPYETYSNYIEEGYYGLYIDQEVAPHYRELEMKKSEYHIGHWASVTTKWAGGRGAEWKTLVTIEAAIEESNTDVDVFEMLDRAHKLDEAVNRPVNESDNNARSPFDFDGNVYVCDGDGWTDDTHFEVVGKRDRIIIRSYNSSSGDADERVVSTYEEAAEFVNDVLTGYGEVADTWQELGWYLNESLTRENTSGLKEAAFSGGMAGDNSFSGGTVRGIGASTQPSKKNYLGRLKSKNADLVDILTVKGKEIKPGMITSVEK